MFTKQEFEKFKLYFSSLTTRKCPFYYLNIYKNDTIIGTNGNTVEKNNMLLEYSHPDLSIHVIEIKDTEFLDLIYKEFYLPKDEIVRLFAKDICSFLNKNLNNEPVYNWINDELICTVGDESVKFAEINTNYQVILNVDNIINSLNKLDSHNKFYIKDIKDRKLDSNSFIEKLAHDNFEVNVILFDGLDVASKDLIKKIKDAEFTYILKYYIFNNDSRIEFITEFEDSIVKVKSVRPFFRLYNLRTTSTIKED